jgi:hypothetical protein
VVAVLVLQVLALQVLALQVLALQVREQEQWRQRERPDKGGNPRPVFEAASATLGNSTGKIERGPQIGTEHFRRSVVLFRRERANAFKKPACRTRNEDHEISGAGTTVAGH